MGHQLAAGRLTEEIARHPAQNPLPQLSVAEGASDDEVGGFLLCERFELDADNRRGRPDRNPTEPGKDRRGAAGGGKGPTARSRSCRLVDRSEVQRAGKGKRLVIENGAEAEVNAGLVEMIKEAFAIRNQLLSGSHDSIEAMSGRLGMNKGRLTSLVRLSYLDPEIVRALLAGSQSNALTPSRLLRLSQDLPHDWKEQRRFLGFAA